jgi:hypothetical protein
VNQTETLIEAGEFHDLMTGLHFVDWTVLRAYNVDCRIKINPLMSDLSLHNALSCLSDSYIFVRRLNRDTAANSSGMKSEVLWMRTLIA